MDKSFKERDEFAHQVKVVEDVTDLLNAECRRIYDTDLDEEQISALYEPDECFGMLDDMEARMGFDVDEARELLQELYE